jgi:hypothetical protein
LINYKTNTPKFKYVSVPAKIENHRYFTTAANKLCHDGKLRNLALLRSTLRQCMT